MTSPEALHALRRRETSVSRGEGSLPRSVSKTRWVPDAKASACMVCQASFSWVTRKHHCRSAGRAARGHRAGLNTLGNRSCGIVVCGKCSKHQSTLGGAFPKPVRVCDRCHGKVASQRCASRAGVSATAH
jgi:hypothetical protein